MQSSTRLVTMAVMARICSTSRRYQLSNRAASKLCCELAAAAQTMCCVWQFVEALVRLAHLCFAASGVGVGAVGQMLSRLEQLPAAAEGWEAIEIYSGLRVDEQAGEQSRQSVYSFWN